MSLASSPDCLLRPEEKAIDYLFPAVDQVGAANSFDDFFNKELYESSEEDLVKSESGVLEGLFAASAYSSANEHDLLQARSDQSERSSPQPWRKGLWCLNQKPASQQLVIEKTRRSNNVPPPNISPTHLVANDNFALKAPRSLTQPVSTKSLSPTRLQQSPCWSPAAQQSPTRGMALSPSPMYSRSNGDERDGYIDAWQQDFQNFSLQLSDEYLESLPISNEHLLVPSNISFAQSRRAFIPNTTVKMEGMRTAMMHHFDHNYEQNHISNQSNNADMSLLLNANLNAASRNMFSEPPDRNDMAYRFINEELPPMSDWTSQSPGSSNNSQQSQFSSLSLDTHHANMYNTLPPQNWWSPPTASAHTQPARDIYPELVQPKPRRATHHVLNHETHEDGLDIKYPSSEEIGVAIPYHPPELQPSAVPSTQPKVSAPTASRANGLGIYPALPPPVHNFPEGSPFTTPSRKAAVLSRSPSPPISPTHRMSRSIRQRSPSRRDVSQHRRKSIHKPGPVRDNYAETPRHRSTSRPPRTPKTPKTPGDGFQVGFVNFTPKDASKLLSDVAPSGSSKTRARREQEARDRRKKLSEAALNAVRQAGGDVEALERAILT